MCDLCDLQDDVFVAPFFCDVVIVLLSRHSVLEGCAFALPCHCDLRFTADRLEVSCLAGACERFARARFGKLKGCRNRSKSFRNPLQMSDMHSKIVKVGVRDRRNTLTHVSSEARFA